MRFDGPPGEGHFDTISVVLQDLGHDSTICGDLTFDGRQRSFSASFATNEGDGLVPYVYWWRGARSRNNGTYGVDSLWEANVVPHTPRSTGPLPMPLGLDYDGIAAVLIKADTTLQRTDSAFRDVNWGPGAGIQHRMQYWRRIDPPVLDSGEVSGDTVTIWWINKHQGRVIDSTIVYRGGVERARRGPTDTTFADPDLANDTYEYRLKHFSTPVAARGSLAYPNSDSSNTLVVTVGGPPPPTACATAEYTSTWKVADQYLSAGCSQLGPTKRFRWQPAAGAPWTPWTTDTLYDFLGHTQAGSRIVVLQDSNTSTGATSRDTLLFTVANRQVTLHGPLLILDKGRKTYWADSAGPGSPHSGQWFERYDDGPRWYVASAYPQDTLKRIWPYGDYYEDLRQHRVSQGVLHRGRLHVIVCSIPDCEPEYAPPPGPPGAAAATVTDWGLFGAGPWLTWGSAEGAGVLRFYDLWGNPDRATVFGDAAWVAGTGGRVTDAATGWDLAWTRRELGLPDVRAFDVGVAGAGGRAYAFGLALDPDLGPNGGDDVASYDTQRGLLLVADGSRAVGFLLRTSAGNAIQSVQEYGVGRWAPVTGEAAWAGQRAAGIHLVSRPRDVQLVLSAAETAAAGRWLFVLIRGDSPSSVQARADAVLDLLR